MEEYTLSEKEKQVLMELQYRFPRSARPLHEAASRIGLELGEMVSILARLRDAGVLKRVGFYVNYRSQGLKAALIAYATEGEYSRVEELYRDDGLVTHVYVRDHPVYDVWVVVKRRSLEEILQHAREASRLLGSDYIVLYGSRTHKLSVKYDLYRGVSLSGPYSKVRHNPPDPGLPWEIVKLYRSLELSGNPYRRIAEALGCSEEEAAETAWRLLDEGVLGDPGAALDGWRIGFRENLLVAMTPRDGASLGRLCSCVAGYPHTTHVVERTVYPEGAWSHRCFAMLHASTRALLDRLLEGLVGACSPSSYVGMRSLADLKPGAVR